MKHHILLYNMCDPGVGGLAQYNHLVLTKLVSLGYRVTSIQCQHFSPLSQREKELGVEQVWLDYGSSTDLPRLLKDLETHRKLLTELQPDLILFSDGWPLDNLAAKQVALELKIPYIVAIGLVKSEWADAAYDDGVSYVDLVAHLLIHASAVVVAAHEHLNLLHDFYKLPKQKGQVIYYGRPPKYFEPPNPSVRQRLRQEVEIPDDAVVCLTTARLEPIKGHRFQLEAIAQLKQRDVWSNLYFVWAGTGVGSHFNSEPELRDRVHQLGVSDRVKFLGHRWDIPDWLDASDIFVLTSLAEAAPSIAAMEAMAKGLPVIGSAAGGIPEGLGNTGKLLPDPNVNSQATVEVLIETIQTWAADPALRQAIGQGCKRRAEQLFRVEPMLDATLKQIEQTLQANPVAPAGAMPASLESSVPYSQLVWRAWFNYYDRNLTDMAAALQRSLQFTPFSRAETILNWVNTFARLSQEKGEAFDTNSLVQSAEWQRLTDSISVKVGR